MTAIPEKVLEAFTDRSALTVPELARAMEMDVKTIRKHVQNGQLPGHLKGLGSIRRHLMFTLSDVERFYNNTSSEPVSAPEPVKQLPTRRRRRVRRLTGKQQAGFVYYVSTGDFIKIGWSRNWKKRVGSLQTAFPHKLEVLLVHEGTKRDELNRHLRFEHLLAHGEWHSADSELTDYIDQLKASGVDVR